jgi:hypothetical protein
VNVSTSDDGMSRCKNEFAICPPQANILVILQKMKKVHKSLGIIIHRSKEKRDIPRAEKVVVVFPTKMKES